MNKKYLSALMMVLFIAGIFSQNAFSQDDEMKRMAKEDMKAWSKSFSKEQVEKLGYKDKGEFNSAELGDPYKVYTIDPNKLVEYGQNEEFERLLESTGYIAYPVISEGRSKSLLWMYQKDNEWKIARVGSAGLSQDLRSNEARIEKQKEELGLNQDQEPMLVRLYQLYLDFFYLKGEEREYMVPMANIPALDIKGGTFYPAEEMIPMLQEQLKGMMPFKNEEGEIKEY